ncbi:MAG: FimB/Mfa2 family fimbrial subunit [Dysgonamonadaceae bacterium]|nr:FimB/Mfa2 family fimbrial subunit [Dysgonamonadaceae bacterium]
MNRMKYYICTAIYLLLFLSSCIKDDLTNCPPVEQSLQVIFSSEDETELNIQSKTLQKATLFVFDKNDNFVTGWLLDEEHQERPALDKTYVPDFKLLPGEYHFIVWFDLVSPYSVTPTMSNFLRGTTRINQAEFHLEIPENRSINTPLPLLLYGYKEGVIKTKNENTIVIPVAQNTNTINITVTGLPQTTDEYLFRITDTNGKYTFYGEFADCEEFSYVDVEKISMEANTLTSSLTVLKLDKNRHPLLTIQNQSTGEQIFPVNNDNEDSNDLIEMILREYPDIDFKKTHVYNVKIDIDDTNVTVTVDIDGWIENPSDDEIVPD